MKFFPFHAIAKMTDSKEQNMTGHSGKAIFIAEVSPAMAGYRENLIKELTHHGCVIRTPNSERRGNAEEHDIIENCDIAVHILSDTDTKNDVSGKGLESDQIRNSVGHHQSRKILSDSSENGFRIYAWHPKSGSENIYEEEQVPDHLKKIQHMEEVELLRTNFEDFKFYLLKKLESFTPEVSDEFYIKGSDNYSVYFIYDNIDTKAAKEYIDYLGKRGFTVMSPDFGSDILSSRQHHTACLKKFDIAIIFALDAGLNWINMKIMDIMKSPGLGREKAIMGKGVFTEQQKGVTLQLKNRGFEFCEIEKSFSKEPLENFLGRISR